jgi:hypothetical protein
MDILVPTRIDATLALTASKSQVNRSMEAAAGAQTSFSVFKATYKKAKSGDKVSK